MKIVVLEDKTRRMKKINKLFSNHEIIHFQYCEDFIEFLKDKSSNDVNMFLLDHDLMPDSPMNGNDAVDFLIKRKFNVKTIIHSTNKNRGREMFDKLKKQNVDVKIWPLFYDEITDINDLYTKNDQKIDVTFDKVFEIIKEIPAGKVMTITDLAKRFNRKSTLTVSYAVKDCPISIPKHRIVKSDGLVKPENIEKLKNENVKIENSKIIDLQNYLYK